MTTFMSPRRDPSVPARTIPEGKVQWLGDAVAGHQYGVHNGQEYAVDVRPADPEGFIAQDGEMLVNRKFIEEFDGSRIETVLTHRAFPVASGTYAALAARRTPRKARRDQPRVWDRLARLSAMQRREPLRLATGPATSAMDRLGALPTPPTKDEQRALGEVVDLARTTGQRELISVGGHEPPQPGGFVAYFLGRHIELTRTRDDRLIARSGSPISADDLELLDLAEPLIVGELGGPVAPCSLCDQPATSIAIPRAPVCAQHAQ